MSFGSEVKRLREAAGLTQVQVSEQAGLSQPHLARIERDQHPAIGIDIAFRLADALGVSVEHFRPYFAATAQPVSPPPLVGMGKRK